MQYSCQKNLRLASVFASVYPLVDSWIASTPNHVPDIFIHARRCLAIFEMILNSLGVCETEVPMSTIYM